VKSDFDDKIKSIDEIVAIVGQRPRDQSIIMCHGTFDILHPGHVRHLLFAKSKADVLICSLTCDEHIKKANFRPFVPENLRAINLSAMAMVDYVVIDEAETPLENIAKLQPDFFAKGYEYSSDGLHPKTQQEKDVLDEFGGQLLFTPGDVVYSSSKLIEATPPNLSVEKLLTLLTAENLTFQDLYDAVDNLSNASVHVVGDTIIDSYTETSVIGGQTKTPTVSVRFDGRRDYVGGAGIVAKHIKAAGARVDFTTVIGDDENGKLLVEDMKAAGVVTNAIVDTTRPTTNKNAIVCDNYRLLKVDTVDNRSISDEVLAKIQGFVKTNDSDAVVLSDFRHGIFNGDTIPSIIGVIPDDAFKVADSQVASRWGNILEFQNFDLITPNEREARFALGDQDSVIRPVALRIFEESHCRNLILKLGERGILGYRCRSEISNNVRAFFVVDSFAGKVVDAVGAGDALLAYATLAHSMGAGEVIAAVLGTIAASIECEHDGNEPIDAEQVRQRLNTIERAARYAE
jgi:rfaE bifunctional protein kinase chain/domain